MAKLNRESNDEMFRILEAESHHPRPEELPTIRFPVWSQPKVRFTKTAATAIGYTRSFGLLKWTDVSGEVRLGWVAATLISRVGKEG